MYGFAKLLQGLDKKSDPNKKIGGWFQEACYCAQSDGDNFALVQVLTI